MVDCIVIIEYIQGTFFENKLVPLEIVSKKKISDS